ncbi:hypothetical protein, partial [Anaplasma marginale]|uniref:hypothetical protein n=1 Tax=Anaplasma marginale TaxID=770 RepID=UPI0019D7086C
RGWVAKMRTSTVHSIQQSTAAPSQPSPKLGDEVLLGVVVQRAVLVGLRCQSWAGTSVGRGLCDWEDNIG